ncbi:phenylalanine--tRNA ligase subunit beta [Desemzia sp. RIT804]|uniref:phenylalanine--tRNA ligase subunit beta n=1 Tax=Desemzia sp. RIT 804 TaxID=2810209 RepID=UPI001951138F|nr:phenylalanine--tRNA ligase subunit beta [Desemzia sp. RIT 804]MBM6613313.1 phenylalanine--tRNA ligase subunit beta [Desemzia sp. RIT 804]
MNVSYKWLAEYLNLESITPENLADKLSRTGIEVEDVTVPQEGLKKIVVGHAVSVVDHPDSDHLHICQVDIGEEELSQIVCGAPNIEAGQKIIVALPGSRITGNKKIKKSKMRGEVSNGMICSLEELGYSDKVIPKKYAEGIYVLPENAEPGEEVFSYLAMDDAILDLSVTANRADALSMRGVAHEVGAIYNQKPVFETVELNEDATEQIENYMSVAVENTEDTPVYSIRIVKNVKVKESPMWLQTKLMNAGIRPLNNIVDITNYILLEYGQPLHAFDYDQLNSKEILVRRAKQDEILVTLDEEERKLTPDNIVITNGVKPVALAGVMGGLDSHITDETVTVALEAALFEPISVRKTAKELNLRSESSSRFEKGINMATLQQASEHAAALMVELGEGTVVSGISTVDTVDVKDVVVTTTLSKINRSLGTEITKEKVKAIFQQLGFGVEISADKVEVVVPPRRWDIHIEADLIEEVARIYGYDNLPSTLPKTESIPGGLSTKQRLVRHTRRFLEDAGLTQAISYVLTTPEKASRFMMRESEATQLDMPMSEERSTLRMNLLSGLLDDVHYNLAHNNSNVALFETGRVFYKETDHILPHEQEHLAGVLTGSMLTTDWQGEGQKVDFYVLKGILEELLLTYGLVGKIDYVQEANYTEMHPGRTAAITLEGKEIGFMGQIHPVTANELDLNETYAFEINFDAVIEAEKEPTIYRSIPKYPGMTRDVALLVDETTTNQQIADVIVEKGGKYLQHVRLFDLYQGEHIATGKKSMAYTLAYLNPEATLVEEEVTKAFEEVKTALAKQLNAEIR